MDLFGRRKKQLQREKLEAEKKLKKQEELREKLLKEFVAAISEAVEMANKSKKFKTMDNGKIPEAIGDMKYAVMNKGTSITVWVEHSRMYAHLQPVVCQVDIKVLEDRIHLLFGPYGPDDNFDIEKNATTARNIIVSHIKKWTLFP